MQKPYVFISYSTIDQEYADKVNQTLKDNGINTWIATEDIHGGESFATEITNGIKNCDAFVFILSKNSDDSPHCGNELSLAFGGRKKIIPFRLHEFKLSESNTYFLQQAQWIDVFQDEDWAFQELVEKVKSALSTQKVESAPIKISHPTNKKIENFIFRAELELEDKNFNDAKNFANQILNEDPRNCKAYIILMLCQCKVSSLEEIKIDVSDNVNYKRAIRFANDAEKAELEKLLKSTEGKAEGKKQVRPRENKVLEEKFNNITVKQADEQHKNLIENMPINYKYKKPPKTLFAKSRKSSKNIYDIEAFESEVKAKIFNTLKDHGIVVQIPRVIRGSAVTRFDIAIPLNVPISKIVKLQGDINLRIAGRHAIRMIAPVPNSSYVGIEVPNREVEIVNIRDIIESKDFINSKPFSLTFALGKDVVGDPISLDLANLPHVLITGTTGSGKTVCLNSLIVSLITKYGPDELRFVIVDPKQVDFGSFKDIPHMMFGEIIEDVPMANSMLTWAIEEMESRYKLFVETRSKNITDYNTKARSLNQKIMPRIVIIMDEFADLVWQDKEGISTKVCLLVQKARAAGIHLVIATQRPSNDVFNGPLKANIPARIVFRAPALIDSQVSLGEPGAEKLIGRGDCLYKTGGMLNVERVMGAYVSDEEAYAVIDYVSKNNDKYYDYKNLAKIKARVTSSSLDDDYTDEYDSSDSDIDPLYVKAMRVGYSLGGLSISILQRKLSIGYPKAGKIIDWLIEHGYITQNAVNGKRQMVITKEDFEEQFGAE